MAETLTVVESSFTPPEEGKVYDALIESVQKRETPFWEDREDWEREQRGETPLGKKQQEINFKFMLDDTAGEHAGKTVYGSTPTWFDTTPNCKLRRWVQEILGVDEDLPEGYEIQLDDDGFITDWIGVSVRVQIQHKTLKDGRLRYFVAEVVRPNPGGVPGEQPF